MLPLLTKEVRWFYKGEQYQGDKLEAALRRFRKGDLPTNTEIGIPRTDYYLYLPGVEGLGIKFRGEENRTGEVEGRVELKLEVKSRLQEEGVITFGDGVKGQLEHWSKSEFNSESMNAQFFTFLTEKNQVWVAVSKERSLRKYEVTGGKEIRPVPSQKRDFVNGCQVELTKLLVCQQTWWTFGFEAFGETEEASVNTLKLSANEFFTNVGWGVFEEKDSMAYPQWINLLMVI